MALVSPSPDYGYGINAKPMLVSPKVFSLGGDGRVRGAFFALTLLSFVPSPAYAALNIPITVNLSEAVTVTGTPQIAVDVGGTTRYATYTSGTGTNALTFTLAPQAGDVDLDGVTVASPIQLNGGTIKDSKGNDATLTFTPPNTSNVKVNYPSLGMDFVYDSDGRYTLNGTAYNDLTSFLTATGGSFTRASIGTYFDSSGNLQTAASGVPRFDYDPVTHAAKGILIEEGRSNSITYSDQLNNAAWTKVATTVSADVATSPIGTASADKVIATATTAQHYVDSPAVSLISGNSYTYSMFTKAAEWSYIQIALPTSAYGPNVWANFNLSTGAVASTGASAVATIQSVGSGWYRISVKGTSGTTNTLKFATIPLQSDLASRAPTFTGDSTSGVYVWGVQAEQGTFPTSFIPTTTTTATRAADLITIPTGSWYSQSHGAVFSSVSWQSGTGSGFPSFMRIDDTTNANYWNFFYNMAAATIGVDGINGGVSQGSFTQSSATSGSIRMASAQAFNNTNTAFNGVLKTLDTSWNPPTVTQLAFYNTNAARWINKFKYYPARVIDAQLQLLSH